jgi:hypothetical protein
MCVRARVCLALVLQRLMALAGLVIGGSIAALLVVGWGFGTVVSLISMLASATVDLLTGAMVA